MKFKGSAFSSFVISAIIVLVVLLIGGYFFFCEIMWWCGNQKVNSPYSKSIEDTLKKASMSPNGKTFATKTIVIQKDQTFSSKQFSNILNIGEKCIQIDFSPEITSVQYTDSLKKDSIKFNEQTSTSFYITCQAKEKGTLPFHDSSKMSCPDSCKEFCCLASFGYNTAYGNLVDQI